MISERIDDHAERAKTKAMMMLATLLNVEMTILVRRVS